MAKLTKRQQAEALGWKFTPIPSNWGGVRYPAGWRATPPADSPVKPQEFRGTIPAVRWALQQAAATPPDTSLSGVAALVAAMGAAAVSGAVSDAEEACATLPVRPDAELLALCRDISACDRQHETSCAAYVPPYVDRQASALHSARMGEARRERDRLVPLVAEMRPTTPAGLVAKAAVIAGMFECRRGPASHAVKLLAEDIAELLGTASRETGRAGA